MTKNYQKGSATVWVIVIVIVIAAVLYVVLKKSSSSIASEQTNVPTETQSSSVQPVSNDWTTAQLTWGTVQYPSNWSVIAPGLFTEKHGNDGYTSKLSAKLLKNSPMTVNGFLKFVEAAGKTGATISTSTATVNGISGIQAEIISKAVGADWYNDDFFFVFWKGQDQYQFEGGFEKGDPSSKSTFDTFVKSFKLQ